MSKGVDGTWPTATGDGECWGCPGKLESRESPSVVVLWFRDSTDCVAVNHIVTAAKTPKNVVADASMPRDVMACPCSLGKWCRMCPLSDSRVQVRGCAGNDAFEAHRHAGPECHPPVGGIPGDEAYDLDERIPVLPVADLPTVRETSVACVRNSASRPPVAIFVSRFTRYLIHSIQQRIYVLADQFAYRDPVNVTVYQLVKRKV